MRRWPPVLGLRDAVTVTLTYLHRNRVQAEIAEDYNVSQPTISRAISAITPLHTDYRRPLATFPETISAVVALHFYATA
jgi:hypothetical protein